MLRHHRFLPSSLLAPALAVLCTSCGGGGGGGSSTSASATATGKVVLPSGVVTSLSSLKVLSAQGSAAVSPDGTFTVTEPAGGGAATVLLTDPNGNVVMLGHVDTANPSFNDLSATSTAVELLFLATFATTLPQGSWASVYGVLAAAPEAATLAGVIGTEMALSPTAVGDMDPVIVGAIDTAVASLFASSQGALVPHPVAARSRPGPSDAPATFVVHEQAIAQAVGTGNLSVKTDPSSTTPNPGAGLTVAPSDDRNGLVITNTSRINRFYFVYRTGYVPSTGATTDPATPVTPWELVSSGLLPAVSGASGTIATFVDFFSGKATWAPVNTPTIPLPLTPSDALANTYEVYVVGMGATLVEPPTDLLTNGDYSLVVNTQKEMWLFQTVKELLWPVLTKVIPVLATSDPWKSKDAVMAAINNFVKQAGSVGLAWESQILADPTKAWPATATLLKAGFSGAAGQSQVRNALYNLVSTLALKTTSDTLSLVALDKFVSNLYAAIKVVDLVFTAGDVGSVFEQVLSSNNYNIWDVRAMGVTLIMVPPSQTITNPSQSVPFSVTVNGGPTSSPGSGSRSRYYNWSCGPYGTLSDGKTQGSSIVASLSQAVTYSLVGTTLPTSPDKVEVTVFDPSGLEMGTVSGIVKFAPGATVNVALTQPWTDSGLSAAPGQQLTVNTTGTMDYWTGGCPSTQNCNVTPDGLPWSFCSGYSPTFAEPGLSCYSLVGRIGASGAPFEVGSSFTYTVPTGVSGELFLGVNDNNFVDNSGSWTATVAVH